ncbi:MAG: nucleotidyl transferase [uncultured bacterium]|nr:MAG: nucleotidyl transferase [uncultured bacterium]
MLNKINIILLAAGKSSRISSVANGLPKPLIPIAGEPIIFRNLRWINRFFHENLIWINLHYQYELMQDEIKKFSCQVPNLQINFIIEKNILGTAGAVANILSHCLEQQHTLVIYSDNLFNFNLHDFIETHFEKKNLVTIALFNEKKHINTGIAGGKVILDKHSCVTEFIEGEKCTSSSNVNAGIYLFSPEITSHIPKYQFCDFGKFFFPTLLLKKIPIYGYMIDGFCLGLDTPECLARANELINEKKVILI